MTKVVTPSTTSSMRTLLVLGGTVESRALAIALLKQFGSRLRVVISIVKEIARPFPWQGSLRIGQFCCVEGLIAYLKEEGVVAVITATHPFATTIAHNVRLACEACGVPRLTLSRQPWTQMSTDNWIEVDSMAEAARRLPSLCQRAFLTVGIQSLPLFAASSSVWFLIRLLRSVPLPLPPHEPPHCLVVNSWYDKDDLTLMQTHNIEALVTKASGGAATESKIVAARTLGLPVLMVCRPPVEPGERVATVMAAVEWVEATITGSLNVS